LASVSRNILQLIHVSLKKVDEVYLSATGLL
jgi:hypothetical protein